MVHIDVLPPAAKISRHVVRRLGKKQMKTRDGRFTSVLTAIQNNNQGQAGNANFQVVDTFINNLSQANKNTISTAMSQGSARALKKNNPNYATNEKVLRQYRRQLILVLLAKTRNPLVTLAADLNRVTNTVANFPDPDLRWRFENEMKNIMANQGTNALAAKDVSWATGLGWESNKRRPLLAGCAIGRRGAPGPGTLGCFVYIGANTNVHILSNAHVMLQNGSTENEILQPPHMCGGTYYDVVADFVAQAAQWDAAIAKVRPGFTCDNTTPQGTAMTGSALAVNNMQVTKYGCATRHRVCTVTNDTAPNVNGATGVPLQDQLLLDTEVNDVKAYALQVPGDSGSVLVDVNGDVVALAHGQAGKDGLQATHIAPILAHFNAHILVGQVVAV